MEKQSKRRLEWKRYFKPMNKRSSEVAARASEGRKRCKQITATIISSTSVATLHSDYRHISLNQRLQSLKQTSRHAVLIFASIAIN